MKRPEPITVELEFPLSWKNPNNGTEKIIDKVVVSPLRAKHMAKQRIIMGQMTHEQMFEVAANISDQPLAVLEELYYPDWAKVQDAVTDFLLSGQKKDTGNVQSEP